MTKDKILELISKAKAVRDMAYTPYSNFKVGAAVIDDKGNLHVGANVENGSYGLTNCAERTAIFSAVTSGMKSISAIAIIADTTDPVSPCGACRQVVSEFSDNNTVVILANLKMDYVVMNIDEILPYRFKL
ncbi:MAG: cytidine deaminase [Spirochaetaceae bacterium]